MNATSRQTFALFCASGRDLRDLNLTKQQASEAIRLLNEGKSYTLPNGEVLSPKSSKSGKPFVSESKLNAAYQKALEAGKVAALETAETLPVYNVVGSGGVSYGSMAGSCGFAWIEFSDARSKLAKFLCKTPLFKGCTAKYLSPRLEAVGALPEGVNPQIVEVKEAFLRAFSESLRNDLPEEITSSGSFYVRTRMD